MDPSVTGGFLLVAALIVANGVFVATEFAFVRARRTRLQARADAGSSGAHTVLAARSNLDRYIAASQLGITMASIALGFVGEPLFAAAIEPPIEAVVGEIAPAFAHAIAIAFAFVLITGLHIVFGELAPKTIALTRPESTAILVSGPIRLFTRVFSPLISLLNGTGNVILRAVGIATTPIGEEAKLTGRDLVYALESSASVGAISRREQQLARRALELGELTVSELMQPRDRIVSIDPSQDRTSVLQGIARHGRTRYPVVRGSLDVPVGVVDVRDIVLADRDDDWQAHIHPIPLVPDSMTLGRALDELSTGSASIALVADEYGNVDGLIALGDIVSFLAGPLPDEHRRPEIPIRSADGSFLVPGLYRLDAAQAPPLSLDIGETQAHTLGGYVTDRLQRVPTAGDAVTVGGRAVRVVAMSGRRVDRILVEPTPRDTGAD